MQICLIRDAVRTVLIHFFMFVTVSLEKTEAEHNRIREKNNTMSISWWNLGPNKVWAPQVVCLTVSKLRKKWNGRMYYCYLKYEQILWSRYNNLSWYILYYHLGNVRRKINRTLSWYLCRRCFRNARWHIVDPVVIINNGHRDHRLFPRIYDRQKCP